MESSGRYHAPLRRSFQDLQSKHEYVDPGVLLHYATKGLKNIVGPNDSVVSLLVFDTVPFFPMGHRELPEQLERIKAINTARNEAANPRAVQKISTTISSNLLTLPPYKLKIGDLFLPTLEGNQIFFNVFG